MNFTWNNGYKWKLSNDTKERLFVRLIDFIHFLQFLIIIRHINTSVRLSVCLLEAFVCMFVSLSVGISCPYVCLIVCWNLLSVCMSVCWNLLSVCLLEPFVYVHLSVCLLEPSVCMYVCLYLSECLSNSERIMCQHHLNNTLSVEYNTILWRIPVDFN